MLTMIEPVDAAAEAALTPLAPVTTVNVATQALAIVSTQVAEFNRLEAGFVELETRYHNVVYAVETTTGLDEAKKARVEIRQVRFSAQNLLKETTRPLNQLKADVTALADGIVARILLTETPIDEQIKAEETRKATEKAVREQAERELAAAVQLKFQPLEFDPEWMDLTPEELMEKSQAVAAIEVSLEAFGARAGEAELLQENTLYQLEKMHQIVCEAEEVQSQLALQQLDLAVRQQAMDDELAAGRQLLAEQKAQADAEHAEAGRKLNEQLAQLAADQQAAQDKIDAEHVAKRAAQDAIDAAARQALQDAADAAARVAREAAEVERQRLDEEAQTQRIEADRLAAEARAAVDLANAKELQLRDAAPALLSALTGVLLWIDNWSPDFTLDAEWVTENTAARAAINQAQGEQV